ncbi:type II toxin-antitoxin system RelE family toxin [Ihubacter sp. rT4E-8]|uniref:type II toxin-antitoxin system RelE family toxin n=1 Tax=Ihubacter sp. rT4E-8 TaxID=3242369 RepID=UPI003CF0D68D
MWGIKIIDEAAADFRRLDRSLQKQVLKGVIKISQNPLPRGNKSGTNLTGFFKIKYRGIGIRVVYSLAKDNMIMNIIAISQRDDEACYKLAGQLYQRYGDQLFEDVFQSFYH